MTQQSSFKATAGPTVALAGLPGFGWVDAFLDWNPVYRLPFLALLGLLISLPLYVGGASIAVLAGSIAFMVVLGAILAVFVVLARGAQDDVVLLGAEEELTRLRSSWPVIESLSGLVYGFAIVTAINIALGGTWLGWLVIFNPGFVAKVGIATEIAIAMQMLSAWLSGIVSLHLIAFGIRQYRILTSLARTIDIDLFQIDRYQVFSRQPIRYLAILVLFISLCIVLSKLMASPTQFEKLVLVVLIPSGLIAAVFGSLFALPMLYLRNRIHAAKLLELVALRHAMTGDRSALAASQIARLTDEFSLADLLLYEQKIQGIWEWPMQGNVQRILLYVMLPPIAWVLAALVQHLLDTIL